MLKWRYHSTITKGDDFFVHSIYRGSILLANGLRGGHPQNHLVRVVNAAGIGSTTPSSMQLTPEAGEIVIIRKCSPKLSFMPNTQCIYSPAKSLRPSARTSCLCESRADNIQTFGPLTGFAPKKAVFTLRNDLLPPPSKV